MDDLEIARETVYIFFEEKGITVEEAFEKAKKRCLGVDQNNQSTNKNIQGNYNTIQEDLKCK